MKPHSIQLLFYAQDFDGDTQVILTILLSRCSLCSRFLLSGFIVWWRIQKLRLRQSDLDIVKLIIVTACKRHLVLGKSKLEKSYKQSFCDRWNDVKLLSFCLGFGLSYQCQPQTSRSLLFLYAGPDHGNPVSLEPGTANVMASLYWCQLVLLE